MSVRLWLAANTAAIVLTFSDLRWGVEQTMWGFAHDMVRVGLLMVVF